MNGTELEVEKKEFIEPWKNFIPGSHDQKVFYLVSTDFCLASGKSPVSFFLYQGKEVKDAVAYTHPISGIICKSIFENYNEDEIVWLVDGEPNNKTCSIEGKAEFNKITIIKKTNFRISLADVFKVVGATVMKIHEDNTFLNWFLDSLGDRENKDISTLEMSRFSRSISEKYKETNLDKCYEYLAVANLAEFKESKEPEWSKRKKLGGAFLYAIHAAHLRSKCINITEICEKSLIKKAESDYSIFCDSGDCD